MSEVRRFADVELGDDLPEEYPHISMARVQQFARVARMWSPRFTDHEGARAEGFKGAIVPGVMSQGLLASMIHRWAPGCRILAIDTVFRSPIPVDSHPVVRAAVTDTDESAKTVELDITIGGDAGETYVLGTATVQLT